MTPSLPSPLTGVQNACAALFSTGALRSPIAADSTGGLRLRDLALSGEPATLLCHWGCGRHRAAGPHEQNFLDLVCDVAATIETSLGVATSVVFLFTDTHAKINGIPDLVVEAYQASVELLARSRGCSFVVMSSLAVGPSTDWADPAPTPRWTRLQRHLNRESEKLFGSDGAVDRARAYERANLVESAATFRRYPEAIFLHSGIPELRPLLPSLPLMYIYAGRPRINRKPWFQE